MLNLEMNELSFVRKMGKITAFIVWQTSLEIDVCNRWWKWLKNGEVMVVVFTWASQPSTDEPDISSQRQIWSAGRSVEHRHVCK